MARKPASAAAAQLPADAVFAACDNSHDLFVLVQDGKIVRANGAFRNFVGIRAKALAGRDIADFVHEPDRASIPTASDGSAQSVHLRLAPRLGAEFSAEAVAQPLGGGASLMIFRGLSEVADEDAENVAASRDCVAKLRADGAVSLWRYTHETQRYVFDLDFSRPTNTYGDTDASSDGDAERLTVIHP